MAWEHFQIRAAIHFLMYEKKKTPGNSLDTPSHRKRPTWGLAVTLNDTLRASAGGPLNPCPPFPGNTLRPFPPSLLDAGQTSRIQEKFVFTQMLITLDKLTRWTLDRKLQKGQVSVFFFFLNRTYFGFFSRFWNVGIHSEPETRREAGLKEFASSL